MYYLKFTFREYTKFGEESSEGLEVVQLEEVEGSNGRGIF